MVFVFYDLTDGTRPDFDIILSNQPSLVLRRLEEAEIEFVKCDPEWNGYRPIKQELDADQRNSTDLDAPYQSKSTAQ